jgi:hypothetical protein
VEAGAEPTAAAVAIWCPTGLKPAAVARQVAARWPGRGGEQTPRMRGDAPLTPE